MIKRTLKLTAILVIHSLLLIDMPVGYCAQKQPACAEMLSPRLNISSFQMREVILSAIRRNVEEDTISLPKSGNFLSHTVAGSDGCLYVRDERTKNFFEQIEDGTQINIIAPGGGGDTLAAIKNILQLKRMFEQQGKKNIVFRLFFSNVKYGRENPFAGPVSAEFINGITSLEVEGFEKPHFYKVTGKLEVKIPITDKNGKQIVLGEKPLFYNAEWGEGEVAEEAAKMGIELVMMDFCPKASELKEQYSKLTQGKKVVTFVCDVGGDILARIPRQLQSQEEVEAFLLRFRIL